MFLFRVFVIQTAKAKLLEVLPKHVPYEIDPVIDHWEEEPVLSIGIAIESRKAYFTSSLLGEGRGYFFNERVIEVVTYFQAITVSL